jgi:hypothetical protein
MQYSRLRFLILPVLVVGALVFALPRTEIRNNGATSAESQPGQRSRILADETFDSYKACDAAARVAAQELIDSGVRTALASRNALAGSTVYKVYYPGATGRISCRDGRLVNEVIEQR